MLEGEWRPWMWFGMTRTEPPLQLCGKLLQRWMHCFTYPMSLNSLEVIGLTVQLIVIVNALYFGFVAEQQGDCTLDGFAPEAVGFTAADSEEACLELTAASGSSGLWMVHSSSIASFRRTAFPAGLPVFLLNVRKPFYHPFPPVLC